MVPDGPELVIGDSKKEDIPDPLDVKTPKYKTSFTQLLTNSDAPEKSSEPLLPAGNGNLDTENQENSPSTPLLITSKSNDKPIDSHTNGFPDSNPSKPSSSHRGSDVELFGPLGDGNDGSEGDDELDVAEVQRVKKKNMFKSKTELKNKLAASQLFNTAIFRSPAKNTAAAAASNSSDSEVNDEFANDSNLETNNDPNATEDTSMYPKYSRKALRKIRSKSDAGISTLNESSGKDNFFPSLSRRRPKKSQNKADCPMSDNNDLEVEPQNIDDIESPQFIHSDTEVVNISQSHGNPSSKKKSVLRNFTLNAPGEIQSNHNRRHSRFTLDHSPTIDWKDLKNSLKFNILGTNKKKKEENTTSYLKSAELISELSAGAPAAIIAASMFQRDDRNTQRIPILLEQLKLTLTDITSSLVDKNRRYLMELEYGSGHARLRWSVRKEFKDFWSFHSKFKVLAFQGNLVGSKLDLPKFPARHSIFHKVEKNYRKAQHLAKKNANENAEGTGLSPHSSLFGRRNSALPSASSPHGDTISRHISVISEEGSHSASSMSISSHSLSELSSRSSGYLKKSARFTRTVGTFWDTSNVNEVVEKDYIEALRLAVEKYILELFKALRFRADANRLFQFLEVSNMTIRLAPESSFHGKEGYLILRSSAALQGWRVSHWRPNDISQMVIRHTSKWYMVRESYIVCVKDISETNILEVFLVDSGFKVTHSDSTNLDLEPGSTSQVHITFQLENMERKMKLLTNSRRQLGLWMDSINHMKENTIWSKAHRFNSFAPVRTNVQAQWFVDAVS